MTFPDSVDDKLLLDGAHIRTTRDYTVEAVGDADIEFLGSVKINGSTITQIINNLNPILGIDNVVNYGADSTGVASSVTAFNNAIAAANAAGGNRIIRIPQGIYNLTAGISTAITVSGVIFIGDGRGSTTLLGGSGTLFSWGDGVTFPDDGGLIDVHIVYTSPDVASKVVVVNKFARLTFARLTLDNVRQLLELGTSSTNTANNINLTDIKGTTDPTGGSIVIDAKFGAGLYLDDISVSAKNVGFPTNAVDPHPANDTTFIRFGQGSWDTCIAKSVVSNRYNRGVDISPVSSVNVTNIWWYGGVHDYNKSNGIRIAPVSGGSVRSLYFFGGWAVATDNHSVEISGAGVIQNVHFTNFVARQAGKNNWLLSNTAMGDVRLSNCHGLGANRLAATNTGSDQDDLVVLASGVIVSGGRFGEDGQPYVGFVNRARYGVNVSPNLTKLAVTGVQSDGVTGGWSVPATNTAGSFQRLIHNNQRESSNRPDYAVTTTPAVPASGVSETWTGYTVAEFYIYGGTFTSITKNGTQVADGTGPVLVVLRPGDTYSVVYTVAPTVRRIIAA